MEPERYDMTKVIPSPLIPFEMSAEDRIQQLEGFLKEDWLQHHRVNIETLINMYKTGELKSFRGEPNPTWLYLCGGEVFDDYPSDEIAKDRPVWFEPTRQQMKVYSSYYAVTGVMHKFQAALRLKPLDSCTAAERKKLPSIIIDIANDTGSNVLSVYRSDLDQLNFNAATYPALGKPMSIMTASGFIQRMALTVQLRVLDSEGLHMTDWFDEEATIVKNPLPGMQRLSGRNIRKELYFASDRQQQLFTGISKNAIFGSMK